MKNFFANAISNELIFVYGLIALVIILIIVIVIIDKKESRKKPKNLFDTLNMKIISDVNNLTPEDKNEEVKEEKIVPELDIIEMKQKKNKDNFQDLEPIPEVRVEKENFTIPKQLESKKIKEEEETELLEDIASNDFSQNEEEDIYIESDLEKTQAQIRVEEITEALKKAQVEEQIEEDKYAKFEEEQEKDAIISYDELVKRAGAKKIIYRAETKAEEKKEPVKVIRSENKKIEDNSYKCKKSEYSGTFKASQIVSPVYGVQKDKSNDENFIDLEEFKINEKEDEMERETEFLGKLKTFRNNLD